MFFFPFRADSNLYKIPLLTLLISLLCIALYYSQYRNEVDVYAKAVNFCERPHAPAFQRTLLTLSGTVDIDSCLDTLFKIHVSQAKKALIKDQVNRLVVHRV